ncbi:MAG: hypothetical protein V2I33_18420 [Kangiellaceae bacterium]|jgi:hypothetical protein|nr:hypothetical protein [Kangiellaceae bacterium]
MEEVDLDYRINRILDSSPPWSVELEEDMEVPEITQPRPVREGPSPGLSRNVSAGYYYVMDEGDDRPTGRLVRRLAHSPNTILCCDEYAESPCVHMDRAPDIVSDLSRIRSVALVYTKGKKFVIEELSDKEFEIVKKTPLVWTEVNDRLVIPLLHCTDRGPYVHP